MRVHGGRTGKGKRRKKRERGREKRNSFKDL